MNRLDIALAHAAQDRRVFPFKLRKRDGGGYDKIPLVKWKDLATTDPTTIRAWADRFRLAHWGWVLPEGMIVADIDDPEAFAATGLVLPEAPFQSTPSGGYHYLYTAGNARQTVKEVAGLDTRVGGKGWVGLYSADSFAIVDSADIPSAPDWLLMDRPAGEPARWIEPTPDDPLTTRAELLTWAGTMRYARMTGTDILEQLLTAYGDGRITEADSTRPWTRADLELIASEMGAKPPGEPPVATINIHYVKSTSSASLHNRAEKVDAVRPETERHTGAELLKLDLPPLEWAVPDILPEGTTLIVSPPKIGKSSLVLQIAVALDTGEPVLNRIPEKRRPVLYLALEDGPRRLRDRLQVHTADVHTQLQDLDVWLTCPKIGKGLEGMLTDWYDAHPGGVVFIDTLQHIRPEHATGRGVYEMDVADIRKLRDIVRGRSGAFLAVVHHTNKPNEKDDFVAAVSGSHGIAGTVDTVLRVIRKRHDPSGKLEVSGRDVPELELAVIYEDLVWSIDPLGPIVPGETDAANDIVKWLVENEIGMPSEVARGLNKQRDNVAHRMARLTADGILIKGRGGYVVAPLYANAVTPVTHSDSK